MNLRDKLKLMLLTEAEATGPEPIWCEYLETDGHQWIQTGVAGLASEIEYNINIDVFKDVQIDSYPIVYGSRSNSGGENRFYVAMSNSGKKMYLGCGYNEQNLNTSLIGKNTYEKKGSKFYYKGTENFDYANFPDFEVFPMALMTGYFDGRDVSTITSRSVVGRLYHSQFYLKGKMVRDLRPCLHPETLEPCMYDMVNKEYLYNEGTGEFRYRLGFTKLDKIENVTTDKLSIPVRMNNGDIGVWDYTKAEFTLKAGKGYFKDYQVGSSIEGNGYQYIETGFIPHSKSAMQLNFELTDGNPGTSWFVIGGCFNPTNKQVRFQLAFNKIQNNVNFGYGAGGLLVQPFDFNSHEAIIDGYHQECLYDGKKVDGTMKQGDLDINKSDIHLFKTNQQNVGLVNAKISTCILYDKGKAIHNLIAIQKDNFIGMLDTFTMKEYINMGSRDFIINGIEPPIVEYPKVAITESSPNYFRYWGAEDDFYAYNGEFAVWDDSVNNYGWCLFDFTDDFGMLNNPQISAPKAGFSKPVLLRKVTITATKAEQAYNFTIKAWNKKGDSPIEITPKLTVTPNSSAIQEFNIDTKDKYRYYAFGVTAEDNTRCYANEVKFYVEE